MDRTAIWIPYCGVAPEPTELLARWNLDPVLIAVLALATLTGLRWSGTVGIQRAPFLIAIALLTLLFVSPFCALTSALFSARAVHHLALTTLVAPLLVAALPGQRTPGGLTLSTLVHTATFWAWYAPAAYEAALSNTPVYWLMQASLLLSAVALWRAVRAAPMLPAIGALLATMIQMGLLGALLTFAGRAFYAPHYLSTSGWGLSPLEDQQLAGLIMWAPGAGLYLSAALVLLSRWFAREQRAALAT